MQKQGIWVVWIGSVIAMAFGSGWVATIGQWTFGLMLLAHIVECVLMRSVFERAGGSMQHHVVQTLIYGFLHWKPIKDRLESEAASRRSLMGFQCRNP